MRLRNLSKSASERLVLSWIIDVERAMDSTLDKTISRLKRELDVAIKRKSEFASKKRHWEFAEDQRGQGQVMFQSLTLM